MVKLIHRKLAFLFLLFLFQVSFALAQTAIKLEVDATNAGKNILRVKEKISVEKSGEFALFYPKWIPGEHSPNGTLNDLVNLFITANGKPLSWRRDDVEMFAFRVNVPSGAKELDIAFDVLSQPGTLASANLSRIKWNRLILYPKGAKETNVNVTATLKYPDGWQFATALRAENETANPAKFKTVTLERFIDSPAIIGKYFNKIKLSDETGVPHEMIFAADSAEALVYKPESLQGWKNLVKEANAMFGARHYSQYKFLNTLSDVGGNEGLEHNESSENGVGLNALSNEYELMDFNELLGHEFAHSWNGKYRRPAGLVTGDFETPMKAELLWVYEGLTQYLGKVLPTRSGLWQPETFRDAMAETAASLDHQTGRRWRPLVDTAVMVQFGYSSPSAWRNQRRRTDYYDEGALVWMEADVLIRQKSSGKLSLDDFMKKFHGGGQNTDAGVKPYDLNEIITTLNSVVAHEWRTFFEERVYKIQTRAPLGGFTNGGWKLVYNETPNSQIQMSESFHENVNLAYSLGINVSSDGAIDDIDPDLAAAKAGVVPGMTIKKINGEDFTTEKLRAAVDATKTGASLEFEIEFSETTETYKIDYKGGNLYPHLERDAAKTDYLSGIVKPLVSQTFANIPPGFVVSNDPNGFRITSDIRRRRRQTEVINVPANVTKVILSQTEITANCAENSKVCNETKAIEIFTEAFDKENDQLVYSYTVSGGRIVGTGAKVFWDLTGLRPGNYTITAGVDDGCGVCGEVKTQTVVIKECPDCKE